MPERLNQIPYDEYAESAVIGSVILDNQSWGLVPDLLECDHFYLEKNRLIFQAIRELTATNIPVDIITLTKQLRSTDNLSKAGGRSYLIGLSTESPAAINVEHYANIVLSTAYARKAMDAGRLLSEGAIKAGADIDSLISAIDDCGMSIAQIADSTRAEAGPNTGFSTSVELDERLGFEYESEDSNDSTISVGWGAFDRLARPTKTQITTILGMTNAGKTAVGLGAAVNIAMQGIGVHYVVLEDHCQVMWDKLLSVVSYHNEGPTFRPGEIRALAEGRWEKDVRESRNFWRSNPFPHSDVAHYSAAEAWNALSAHREVARNLPITWDDSVGLSATDLRIKIQTVSRDLGTYVVVLDHAHELKTGTGHSRYDEKSKAIHSIRDVVQGLKLVCFMLGQVGRKEGDPSMFWAKETGEIEQVSRAMWCLNRPEIFTPKDWKVNFPHPFENWLVKNKGPSGIATLMMDPLCGALWEPGPTEQSLIDEARDCKIDYLSLLDQRGHLRNWTTFSKDVRKDSVSPSYEAVPF